MTPRDDAVAPLSTTQPAHWPVLGEPEQEGDAVALREAIKDGLARAWNAGHDKQPFAVAHEADEILKAMKGEGAALDHLKALLSAWDKVEPHVNAAVIVQSFRTGAGYGGPPDFADALAAARAYVGEG